jgi:hypothetical protein
VSFWRHLKIAVQETALKILTMPKTQKYSNEHSLQYCARYASYTAYGASAAFNNEDEPDAVVQQSRLAWWGS